MGNTLLTHNSNVEGGANGFQAKMTKIRESSEKLPGAIPSKVAIMLDAIEKQCGIYEDLAAKI